MAETRSARIYPIEFLARLRALTAEEQALYTNVLFRCLGVDGFYSNGGPGVLNTPKAVALTCNMSEAAAKRALQGLIEWGYVKIDGRNIVVTQLPWEGLEDDKRPAISPSLRALIFERDGEACTYCGTQEGPFEIDHVVPLSRGGAHRADNMRVACKPCNRSKSAHFLEDWLAMQGKEPVDG